MSAIGDTASPVPTAPTHSPAAPSALADNPGRIRLVDLLQGPSTDSRYTIVAALLRGTYPSAAGPPWKVSLAVPESAQPFVKDNPTVPATAEVCTADEKPPKLLDALHPDAISPVLPAGFATGEPANAAPGREFEGWLSWAVSKPRQGCEIDARPEFEQDFVPGSFIVEGWSSRPAVIEPDPSAPAAPGSPQIVNARLWGAGISVETECSLVDARSCVFPTRTFNPETGLFDPVPFRAPVGSEVTLDVLATDPDGDPIIYEFEYLQWASSTLRRSATDEGSWRLEVTTELVGSGVMSVAVFDANTVWRYPESRTDDWTSFDVEFTP